MCESSISASTAAPSLVCADAGLVADVRLQMLIYFNALFSVCWGCVWLTLYFYKYAHWRADLMSAFLNPILFFVWAAMEPLRLWFGTTGNLSERVANLAAFFLLTVFPQLFTHVQLLAAPVFLLPFEVIGGALMLVMLVTEAIVSFTATRRLIRKSTAQFHLQHDVDAADAPPIQLEM